PSNPATTPTARAAPTTVAPAASSTATTPASSASTTPTAARARPTRTAKPDGPPSSVCSRCSACVAAETDSRPHESARVQGLGDQRRELLPRRLGRPGLRRLAQSLQHLVRIRVAPLRVAIEVAPQHLRQLRAQPRHAPIRLRHVEAHDLV